MMGRWVGTAGDTSDTSGSQDGDGHERACVRVGRGWVSERTQGVQAQQQAPPASTGHGHGLPLPRHVTSRTAAVRQEVDEGGVRQVAGQREGPGRHHHGQPSLPGGCIHCGRGRRRRQVRDEAVRHEGGARGVEAPGAHGLAGEEPAHGTQHTAHAVRRGAAVFFHPTEDQAPAQAGGREGMPRPPCSCPAPSHLYALSPATLHFEPGSRAMYVLPLCKPTDMYAVSPQTLGFKPGGGINHPWLTPPTCTRAGSTRPGVRARRRWRPCSPPAAGLPR